MTIELDGRCMATRRQIHDHLQTRLELPEYYGRNLDALYDLLTERGAQTHIVVRHRQALEEAMGNYGLRLLDALYSAAQRNPALTVTEE